ncbi:MAG: aminoacyl-tRNA hydrolase, partial [Bacteroidota bacterium]
MGLLRRLLSRLTGAPPEASGAPASGARPTHLLVGLGNPGAQYAATRHNAGFAVVDRLADRLGVALTTPQDGALVAHADWEDTPILLAKPQQYMNRSGGPLAALLARYDLAPEA